VRKNRIKAAWQKWKELSGVVFDRKMLVGVKGTVYETMIRPVMIYGAEAWSPRWKEEELLERTDMRMLRWILGVSLKDRKRNKDIRQALESLVSQTRYGKQDCDGMGTCSEQKMIAVSKRY